MSRAMMTLGRGRERRLTRTVSVPLRGALPGIDAKVVAQRFDKYGGIARVAFATESELVGLLKGLADAYEQCDLRTVSQLAGTDLNLLPETSSWLLHYDVDPATFQIRHVQFASDEILRRVWEKSQSKPTSDILDFISATSNNTVWSSASGKLFESFLAHSLLQRGGTFWVQQFAHPVAPPKGGKKGDRLGAASKLAIPADSTDLLAPPRPLHQRLSLQLLAQHLTR